MSDSKSEKIRQLGATGLKPKEIADKLTAEGVDVKATYVSMILSKERRKAKDSVAAPVATSFPAVAAPVSAPVAAIATPATDAKLDKKARAKAARVASAPKADKPVTSKSLDSDMMISVNYVRAAHDFVTLCGGVGPAQVSLDAYSKIHA